MDLTNLLDVAKQHISMVAASNQQVTPAQQAASDRQSVWAKAKSMLPNDIQLGSALGIGDSLRYADSVEADSGLKGGNRGEGDRMRHMSLAADLAQKYGPAVSNIITTGHEVSGVLRDLDTGGFSPEDKQDLMHNAMGRSIASVASTRPEAANMAANAVQGERMQMELPQPGPGSSVLQQATSDVFPTTVQTGPGSPALQNATLAIKPQPSQRATPGSTAATAPQSAAQQATARQSVWVRSAAAQAGVSPMAFQHAVMPDDGSSATDAPAAKLNMKKAIAQTNKEALQ